jgi:tetratricopeptide (TPR) repeat protein
MSRRVVVVIVVVALAIGGGLFWFISKGESRDPDKAAALVAQGVTDLSAQRWEAASLNFRAAIDADDQSRDAHYNLGYVLQVHDRKLAEAEVEYRKAIKIDPGYDKALYSLAIVRASAQDFDEAIALYRKAIAANPNFAEAHFNLGILLLDHGDKSVGREEITKGVTLKPELGARLATTTTTAKPRKR